MYNTQWRGQQLRFISNCWIHVCCESRDKSWRRLRNDHVLLHVRTNGDSPLAMGHRRLLHGSRCIRAQTSPQCCSIVSVGCEPGSSMVAHTRTWAEVSVRPRASADANKLTSKHQTSVHYTKQPNTTLDNTTRNDTIKYDTLQQSSLDFYTTREYTPTWHRSVTTCVVGGFEFSE